jgi:HlyD family secretion protein
MTGRRIRRLLSGLSREAGPREWAVSGRRALVVGTIVAMASSGVSWWLGANVRSPRQAAAEAAPPPASPITARVEYRTLSERLVLRGTVRVRQEREVEVGEPAGQARAIVTRTPLRVGAAVAEGSLLIEVSGRPVIALRGDIPMYRDLHRGMRGDDVAQLQAALDRLGFPPYEYNGYFGRGTATAVRRLYRFIGYEPATIPPQDTGSPATEDPPAVAPEASVEGQGGQVGASTMSTRTTRPPPRVDVLVPYSEVVFLRRLPARITAVPASVGDKPEGAAVKLATGGPIVEAELGLDEQDLVQVGDRVELEAELVGRRFTGRVERIVGRPGAGKAATGAASPTQGDQPSDRTDRDGPAEGGAVVWITAGTGIGSSLLGQDVRATIRTTSTRGKKLVVPLAAVWATADGGSHVTRLTGSNGEEQVDVEPALSAEGFVALRVVRGRLRAGDLVVVGKDGDDG